MTSNLIIACGTKDSVTGFAPLVDYLYVRVTSMSAEAPLFLNSYFFFFFGSVKSFEALQGGIWSPCYQIDIYECQPLVQGLWHKVCMHPASSPSAHSSPAILLILTKSSSPTPSTSTVSKISKTAPSLLSSSGPLLLTTLCGPSTRILSYTRRILDLDLQKESFAEWKNYIASGEKSGIANSLPSVDGRPDHDFYYRRVGRLFEPGPSCGAK